ncbi:hypothetical protein PC129_g9951 [Phytophthora cactorum]|uniref:NAD(P)-binding domain n=1 Tax=Phytophthora cactorum TaxID=29920 RepID=A0A329RS49_9STRA|nr:hypothetical protein Pcac1_g22196 [Phytophthora cactorum]KAG2834891.1 hypothetical protein PC112_g5895 [Phytophthora cactorum]KAG2845151.1 hypothetical protein PC111_g1672 [Phytophthora cactorum]KAG2860774.1 hypothetical protein PC113_g7758 [Phytophthora cactorum]KAG2920796.1 hypothetical protein PC114_g5942 [Phytophthora cactorum]
MATINKTVLVTDSTRGIGLALVEHFLRAGWNIIGTARAGSNAEKVPMNISQEDV